MTNQERNLRSVAGKCNGWYVCHPSTLNSIYLVIDANGDAMESFPSLQAALTACANRKEV